MKYYDINGDGKIAFEEFMNGLRDELSDRCMAMINKAFCMMDKDNSGVLTVSDIAGFYDVSQNSEFISGRATKDQILTQFLDQFDGARGNNDGHVTKQEFFDYYTDVRQCTPTDEYFVVMMASTWQVPENENSSETKAVVGQLHKNVKARIFEMARLQPSLLQKVFNDFDENKSGMITLDEMTRLIAKCKISVERRFVYPFFKMVDVDNSGGIEYEEFEAYVLSK
jgi:Ca2+-binding EF-hand superfamily protein